jgi:VWFA-related protein
VDLDPAQQLPIFRNVVALTTQLRKDQVTVDMINPFGATEGVGQANYYEVFEKAPRHAGDAVLGNLALQVIATQTGGQVITGSNDVTGALKQLTRETTAGYDLTFVPAPGDQNNEYHQLEVRVREPGLKVRTTAGYYARPVFSEAPPPIPTPSPQ